MTFLLVIVGSLLLVCGTESQLSAQQCQGLGFLSTKLTCNFCQDLARFDLEDLVGDCNKCCIGQTGQKEETVKYEKAILEVCGRRIAAFPQIKAFLKSQRPSHYPGLRIKYVWGASPVIKLLDEDDEVVETLAIDKWDTDAIEEFLDTVMVISNKESGINKIDQTMSQD